MNINYFVESTRVVPDGHQLTSKQLIAALKRIANDIDKSDRPSKSRIASELKKLQLRIRPIRRMATPTCIEVNVANDAEYDRLMNLLSD